MSLESEYKLCVEIYAFSQSLKYFNHWTDQARFIDQYWNDIIDNINKTMLKQAMLKCATELNLKENLFDYEKALALCKTEWRVEMMTYVSSLITKWNVLEIPEDEICVKWSGKEMIICWEL